MQILNPLRVRTEFNCKDFLEVASDGDIFMTQFYLRSIAVQSDETDNSSSSIHDKTLTHGFPFKKLWFWK